MATLEQLTAALIKADAAGNAADAKVFADEIRKMRSTPELPPALQPSIPAASGMPTERKAPTTYEKVREFITPTVEMLGAAGGGLIGAGAGTLVAPGVGTATG